MNQDLEAALRRAETGAILVTEGRRIEGLRLVTSAAYSLLAWTMEVGSAPPAAPLGPLPPEP